MEEKLQETIELQDVTASSIPPPQATITLANKIEADGLLANAVVSLIATNKRKELDLILKQRYQEINRAIAENMIAEQYERLLNLTYGSVVDAALKLRGWIDEETAGR